MQERQAAGLGISIDRLLGVGMGENAVVLMGEPIDLHDHRAPRPAAAVKGDG